MGRGNKDTEKVEETGTVEKTEEAAPTQDEGDQAPHTTTEGGDVRPIEPGDGVAADQADAAVPGDDTTEVVEVELEPEHEPETVKLKGMDEEHEVLFGETGGKYIDPEGAFYVKLTDPPVDICKSCGMTHGHTQFEVCQGCGYDGTGAIADADDE